MRYIESSPARDPSEPPRYPGRRAGENWTARRANGIPVPPDAPGGVTQVSCGPPVDGVEVPILDEEDGELPERKVGQIAIRSDSLFAGYHRRPELNARLFRGPWFLTGDVGYLADGQVFVVGRIKDLRNFYNRSRCYERSVCLDVLPGYQAGPDGGEHSGAHVGFCRIVVAGIGTKKIYLISYTV